MGRGRYQSSVLSVLVPGVQLSSLVRGIMIVDGITPNIESFILVNLDGPAPSSSHSLLG